MSDKINLKERYSFGLGAFGKDLVYGITSTFVMVYFTDVLGVKASFIGVVFFIARFWDAINDLMCGVIVDNTKNKFGKFHTWLVIGTLSNAAVLALMFTDFGVIKDDYFSLLCFWFHLLYACIAFILYYLFLSFCYL